MNRLVAAAAGVALISLTLSLGMPLIPQPTSTIDDVLIDTYYVVSSSPYPISVVGMVQIQALAAILCASLLSQRLPLAGVAAWLFLVGAALALFQQFSPVVMASRLATHTIDLGNPDPSVAETAFIMFEIATRIAAVLAMPAGWAVLCYGALRAGKSPAEKEPA